MVTTNRRPHNTSKQQSINQAIHGQVSINNKQSSHNIINNKQRAASAPADATIFWAHSVYTRWLYNYNAGYTTTTIDYWSFQDS